MIYQKRTSNFVRFLHDFIYEVYLLFGCRIPLKKRMPHGTRLLIIQFRLDNPSGIGIYFKIVFQPFFCLDFNLIYNLSIAFIQFQFVHSTFVSSESDVLRVIHADFRIEVSLAFLPDTVAYPTNGMKISTFKSVIDFFS